MTTVVSIFNAVFTSLFGLVYTGLKWLGPLGSLVGISFLGGVLMVWMFGKVSNQEAIKKTRSRMNAELLALRLFKDDLRVFFGVQYQVLVWTLRYLKHSLLPMVIIMVPVMAILIQLNLHYAKRPLGVGERTLVKIKLRGAQALARATEIQLQADTSVEIETKGVRIPELREVSWRIRGVAPGRSDLTVRVGDESVTKELAVGGRAEGVSSLRTGERWLSNLLYPGEAPIPRQSAVESIEILYPELDISIWGWGMNWLILFFVLSLVFGFSCKGVLGVQI
jgi:hypothetical protein